MILSNVARQLNSYDPNMYMTTNQDFLIEVKEASKLVTIIYLHNNTSAPPANEFCPRGVQ